MSEQKVQTILEQIDQLSADERAVLERRLAARRAEADWLEIADDVRRIAEEKGIDDAAIDLAVHKDRYGQ